ncbi:MULTISPECIES: FAD-dependent oxidoreductase [unclassified Nocardioides]|uniref:FAD-dependent oxidoreductase n=1 Tax=unclassified Nocardioides TaxID=2615069 RepID=UPI0006FB4C94|nr:MULTISPECIES: FAD-dependent oxidoreductase [unclassified Nocardioides]KRA38203.1 hypothetical protein ASD81_06005 [Nocardioides sp. Root614]KRA92163.1 hypothetical protein ASD84_06270 [Nocardioides sp. Root682]
MTAVDLKLGKRPPVDEERPFPPYVELPRTVPRRAWHYVRLVSVAAYLGLVVLLVAEPEDGLYLLWNVVVPLLPVMFFVAPGVWRNICPLAAANQMPRSIGRSRALKTPTWLAERGHFVAITAFLLAVALRRTVLNTDGRVTAIVLAATITVALVGGLTYRGKSGWCSSICPLLPVQRLYGQTPFVTSPNSHCEPCVGCTKNCYDFNPPVAYQADMTDANPDWGASRRVFAGLFPGLVLGYNLLPSPDASGDGTYYLRLAACAAASAGIFLAVQGLTRLTWAKVAALWGATAFVSFYWFAGTTIAGVAYDATGADMALLRWPLRAVALALAVAWLVRTFALELRFKQIVAAPVTTALRIGADRLQGLQDEAEHSENPCVRVEPEGRELVSKAGSTILDVVEAAGLPIEAGCRMGMCGADPVAIRAGAANLDPMTPDEAATLRRLGLPDGNRLACQAVLRGDCTVALKPDRTGPPAAPAPRTSAPARSIGKVVILGGGIAGVSVAERLREADVDCEIALVNREPHHLYNRMGISRVIYGRSAMAGLYLLPDDWFETNRVDSWLNTLVSSVDTEDGVVRMATGEVIEFDHLVFATGARPIVPDVPGFGVPGTFVLREASDAAEIRAHAQRTGARRAFVGGGGLLGLEAAYSLHKLGISTTVLERGERLLARGADETASQMLTDFLTGTGIEVRLGVSVEKLAGTETLEGLRLSDGTVATTDLFLCAIGVAPDADLARAAGLEVNRGIVVDEQMRTSSPNVYACGDVAEFEGRSWGLWPTAVRQAEVVAAQLLGEHQAFTQEVPPMVLKGVGVALASAGRIDPEATDEVVVHQDLAAGTYAKLVVDDGQLVGGLLFGHTREVPHLQRLVGDRADVTTILADLRAGDVEALTRLGR